MASLNPKHHKTHLILSWSYWFSSRSLGLATHPYLTMRAISREQFLRPLIFLPLVAWLTSWLIAVALSRIGLVLSIIFHASFNGVLVSLLLFLWVWLSVLLLLWQATLIYLFLRFRQIALFRE